MLGRHRAPGVGRAVVYPIADTPMVAMVASLAVWACSGINENLGAKNIMKTTLDGIVFDRYQHSSARLVMGISAMCRIGSAFVVRGALLMPSPL